MSLLKIAPNFIPENNQMFFSSKDLNSFQRAEYQDTFGFYQQNFGLYSFMRLNRMYKYIVHTPKGTPLVWQSYNSCNYDETGSLTIGQRELTPDPVYMNEKFCHDVLLDSAYEHFLQWGGDGDIDLNEEGQKMLNALIAELMSNAAYGARLSLTGGQLFGNTAAGVLGNNNINFDGAVTNNIKDLFYRTHPSVRGWVKLFVDMAASDSQFSHLNMSGILPTQFDSTANFLGDILDVYDQLRAGAPKPLQQLINRGGIIQAGRQSFTPLFVVSDSMYAALIDAYNRESGLAATNRPRIVPRDVSPAGSAAPSIVYYLDNRVPVVPLCEVNGFDEYLTGQTHFAGIIASGNIQLGTSFTSVPMNVENADVGMIIERDTSFSNNTYGRYTFASHALMKAALADHQYAVATVQYAQPS